MARRPEPMRTGETEGGGKRQPGGVPTEGYFAGARVIGELGGSGSLASARSIDEGQKAEQRPVLDADRASWLKNDLRAVAELAAVLSAMKRSQPRSLHEMYESALQGAVQGMAREICGTFGYVPGENLEPYADRTQRKWVL